MKDFKCPQCAGELNYLENQPFVICDYCGSKAVLPDMPQVSYNITVSLSDEKFITIRGEQVKISPYVGDTDIQEQAELLEEMYRLISIGQFDEAKKLVYVVDRKINVYNSAFIALQRVGMIMIKFGFKTEQEILNRTRPMNDENLAYIIKGACVLADKIVAYNERLEFRNKKEMLEKVNASAKEYFCKKSSNNSKINAIREKIAKNQAEIEKYEREIIEQENETQAKSGLFDNLFGKKDTKKIKDDCEKVDYKIKTLQKHINKLLEEINQIENNDNQDYSYNHYKNAVESYAEEFSKTHDVKDVYFDKNSEQMASRKEREDYKDFNVPNKEVFDFYSIFEN